MSFVYVGSRGAVDAVIIKGCEVVRVAKSFVSFVYVGSRGAVSYNQRMRSRSRRELPARVAK